jgi:hypothetical protein
MEGVALDYVTMGWAAWSLSISPPATWIILGGRT